MVCVLAFVVVVCRCLVFGVLFVYAYVFVMYGLCVVLVCVGLFACLFDVL